MGSKREKPAQMLSGKELGSRRGIQNPGMAVTVRQSDYVLLWFRKAHHSDFKLRTGYDVGTAAEAVAFSAIRQEVASWADSNNGVLRR
jgi:hypothetical protein